MPTNRNRIARDRKPAMEDWKYEHMERGEVAHSSEPGRRKSIRPFLAGNDGCWDSLWRTWWNTGGNGDALTRRWIQENPGSRPWAWWMVKYIDALVEKETPETWLKRPAQASKYYMPLLLDGGTEADFLDKHDLLTKSERKALGR